MVNQVAPQLYHFVVTLPRTALKAINNYVIKGKDRVVLFDTGYNLPECKADLLQGLADLDLAVKDVDLVLTHLHADHTGLVNLFSGAGCRIYASTIDGNYANGMATGTYWDTIESLRDTYGMKEGEILITDNPGYNFRPTKPFDFIPLDPGDTFDVGDYHFQVLNLIGHTPAHIGLYDAAKKLIMSGDTVLDPMTPNITYWGPQYPAILGTYIQTLEMLKRLDIKVMMATHRQIIRNPRERITAIISHHYERMQEILDTMTPDRPYTVRELSAKITWRIKVDGWDNFPKAQKWFAAGETMAHADYLRHLGYLTMAQEGKTVYFTKVKDSLIYPERP